MKHCIHAVITKRPRKGDRVVFNRDIVQGPTEDTPAFVLAYKGEKGTFFYRCYLHSGYSYYIDPDKGNPFYADRSDFQIITE